MSQSSLQEAIETAKLLFVSRDSVLIRAIWSMGESSSWQLEIVGNVWEAMERVQAGARPDLLLLDLPQGDADGLHMLRWLHGLRPGLPIILIGHPGDVPKREDAIRVGARDYLVRPIEKRQLVKAIRSHLSSLCESIDADMTTEQVELINEDRSFIGVSPVMRKLRDQAASLAQANLPVLIRGEGGSGKETTARLVHKLSHRSGFQFAKVNCAVLPGDLLEREIFGYEWGGAMTPVQIKKGKLELAVGGTMLLDEITEMPPGVQANLVRVLRNRQFMRPGTSAAVEVDIRIVASSTRNIERAVSEKRFREDLYYILSAYTIHVPPLRERKEEVPVLLLHFMHRLATQYALAPRDLPPAMLETCQAYSWPGNLRELESFVKRYLMTGDKQLMFLKSPPDFDEAQRSGASHWSSHHRPSSAIQPRFSADGTESLRSLVQSVKSEAERNAIVEALEKTGGNRKAAAGLLRVSYRTLLYKIEQYQLKSSETTVLPGRNGHIGNGPGD